MPTQGAESRAKELLELAEAEFGILTDSDRKLFSGVARGEHVELDGETIEADRIAWLCVNTEAAKFVTSAGVSIVGARVDGMLNLFCATVHFPLKFWVSEFSDPIDLIQASLTSLHLIGVRIPGLRANGLKVEGDIFFRNHINDEGKIVRGFKSNGEVNLVGAKVGGQMTFDGAEFVNIIEDNPEWGKTLNCDGIEVAMGVYLQNGFKAKGEVRFPGAKIGGQFSCIGAEFEHRTGEQQWGMALVCDGMEVNGSVFLRDGFKSRGEVRLQGANISGFLDCRGGEFHNPNWSGNALGEESGPNKLPVRAMNLARAEIGNDIIMDSWQLNESDIAPFLCQGRIDLQSTICKKKFVLRNVHKDSKIELDLRGAKVGVYLDDKESWDTIVDGGLHLDGFVYDRFYDESAETGDGKNKEGKASILPAADRLKWLAKQGKKRFLPQPYKQLAKVYRESGHSSDETKVLIECERERARSGRMGILERMWHRVLRHLIGYGYRPSFALGWAVLIVLIGMVVLNLGILNGPILPAPGNEALTNYEGGTIMTLRYSFLYSLDVFLPVVNLHVADKWDPRVDLLAMRTHWRWVVPVYYWFEIIMGWVLTTLLIAALSGLMQRRE